MDINDILSDMKKIEMPDDMQGRINREEIFGCDEVLDKYQTESAKKFVVKK